MAKGNSSRLQAHTSLSKLHQTTTITEKYYEYNKQQSRPKKRLRQIILCQRSRGSPDKNLTLPLTITAIEIQMDRNGGREIAYILFHIEFICVSNHPK